jgi:RNA polymerase sigma-70 factor (ECF subfamily)
VLRARTAGSRLARLVRRRGDADAWLAVDDDTPHGELERIELASELERGIRRCRPLYRESFVLKHVEGLAYDEMSEILGVPRDTLKMRVYKARTLLCRSLSHLAGVR